jgi:hypothetical protein
MARQGYIWPLQVIFITFLILGMIGLISPRFFDKIEPMPLGGSLALLIIAVAIAVLLYLPPVKDILRGAGSLRSIDDLTRSPEVVKGIGEMRRNLERLVERVGDPTPSVTAEIQRIDARLDAISATLAALRTGGQ